MAQKGQKQEGDVVVHEIRAVCVFRTQGYLLSPSATLSCCNSDYVNTHTHTHTQCPK